LERDALNGEGGGGWGGVHPFASAVLPDVRATGGTGLACRAPPDMAVARWQPGRRNEPAIRQPWRSISTVPVPCWRDWIRGKRSPRLDLRRDEETGS